MSEINAENNVQIDGTNSIVEDFEIFIQNNKDSGESALSPKTYNAYYKSLDEIKNSQNGSSISFGIEGFTNLVLYKNEKGIFMFSIFYDGKICSYCMICENETNDSNCQNQLDKSNDKINLLESFIKNNNTSYGEPFSPKLNKQYNRAYNEIIAETPFSYRIIGTEGMRTLLLYKNTNAIFFFEIYMDTIESYYVLEEIQ